METMMIDMNKEEVEQLLETSLIGRLSMVEDSYKPYTIPLPFLWANDSIYLRLAPTGRKGEILALNDRVCFEVDAFTQTLDEYSSVLVEGRLIGVPNLTEKQQAKDLNAAKYERLRNGYRP